MVSIIFCVIGIVCSIYSLFLLSYEVFSFSKQNKKKNEILKELSFKIDLLNNKGGEK